MPEIPAVAPKSPAPHYRGRQPEKSSRTLWSAELHFCPIPIIRLMARSAVGTASKSGTMFTHTTCRSRRLPTPRAGPDIAIIVAFQRTGDDAQTGTGVPKGFVYAASEARESRRHSAISAGESACSVGLFLLDNLLPELLPSKRYLGSASANLTSIVEDENYHLLNPAKNTLFLNILGGLSWISYLSVW
jgi:hypothetical protein